MDDVTRRELLKAAALAGVSATAATDEGEWSEAEAADRQRVKDCGFTEDEGVLPRGDALRLPTVDVAARPRAPGLLAPITTELIYSSLDNPSGTHQFTLEAERLEPGAYVIVCRAQDPTRVHGERLPWVLSDPNGVLSSERRWNLIVK